ncbi:MAG TPA: ankyrin repeat domain-containing protein [Noviherbaspirillum sp.]|nr:ankyrin repeat domain-containing protein [Noviherbaspirillum sp.]
MATKKPKKVNRPGVDGLGRTPLHYASADGKDHEVSRLLSEGADPNARDDNGWSPLHFAAQASAEPVVALLVAAGAEIDALDSNGNTPLSNAVFSSTGDGTVINVLRNAGADPTKENEYGVSPLSLAREIANYDVAQFFADIP